MKHIDTRGYAAKRILVTGGSGFIGAALCRRLVALGSEVHAVSRRVVTDGGSGVTWWQGDLADHDTVRRLFGAVRPHIVFHLASEVTGGRQLELVLPTLRGNLVGAVNLYLGAAEHGVERVVAAGSLEEPDDGDTPAVPCSPYAAAKWASAGYARMFHALYRTPITIARLFMVYGPAQKDLRKLVPYVILSLLRGISPQLSSGTRPVDWIYVDDVVSGLLATGIAPHVDGKAVDLGTGVLVTTREVVEQLGAIIAVDVPLGFGTLPDRPLERVRTADVQTTRRLLDWAPGCSLRQGLEQTVLWYRQQLESGSLRP